MPRKTLSIDDADSGIYIEDEPAAIVDSEWLVVTIESPQMMTFKNNGEVVGQLSWNNGVLEFDGKLEWSARALAKYLRSID